MRVLLTGATGFVGQYVARKLMADGVDIVTLGREKRNFSNQHIQTDLLAISNHSAIVNEAAATHLIHLAWYTEHGKYWSSSLNLDWVKATEALVKAFCISGGKHITIAGTCAEYDWNHGYCSEDLTPTIPKSIYGIAKDATRQICQTTCSEFGVPLAWGRVFFPYGKGEPESRLLPSLAAVFQNKKNSFGVNGHCYRDFLHVTDVASAFVALSSRQATGCINISSGEPVRICDVVSLLAQMMSADPSIVLQLPSARLDGHNMLVGSNERLLNLGWSKFVSLTEGLKDFY